MDRFWRLVIIVVSGFVYGWLHGDLLRDIKGLRPDYSGLEARLRGRLWGLFGAFYLMLAMLCLTGCASSPASPPQLDVGWRTNYRLVRIVYVGSRTDFATQHLCPVGDSVYTVFEDIVDHTRLWHCSPPKAPVGAVVGLYE